MNNRPPPVKMHEDAREWEIQEHGMRAAGDHESAGIDPAAENYRRVALALLSAPHSEPPADFAAAVMEQIAVRNDNIERALLRGLGVVLAAASVMVTALYGGEWWSAMQGALTGGALQWVVVGASCLALSWVAGRLDFASGERAR